MVRKHLVRSITEQHLDTMNRISAIILEPALEYEFRGLLRKEPEGETLALPPDRALELCRRISAAWTGAVGQGHDKVVFLCDFRLRPHLASMLSRQVPSLPVLAYDEIAPNTAIQSVGSISLQEADVAEPEAASAN